MLAARRAVVPFIFVLCATAYVWAQRAGDSQTRIANVTPVTTAMLEAPAPSDWLHWRRTIDSWGYSPLDQINTRNASQLELVWSRTGKGPGRTGAPLVHDGVMFIPLPRNVVQAVDAATGDLLWEYEKTFEVAPDPGFRSNARSLAIYGDKVFAATADAHLVALNARTGRVEWDRVVADRTLGYGYTSGPVVIKGKVIAGMTGCERYKDDVCFISAHDPETGRELWRTNTVTRPGEPGGNTWGDLPLRLRAGGDAWIPGSYDPKTNLIYWSTAQPKPWGRVSRGTDGAALYTSSTLALDPDTGRIVWYHQFIPGESHDFDEVYESLLIDHDGRQSLFKIGKLGILWEIDRTSGKFVSAHDLGYQTVAEVNRETGQVIYRRGVVPTLDVPLEYCPGTGGIRNAAITAYHPGTQAIYIPIHPTCGRFVYQRVKQDNLPPAPYYSDPAYVGRKILATTPHPLSPDTPGYLVAMDIRTGKILWRQSLRTRPAHSVLTTGGGLVTSADGEQFYLDEAATGRIVFETRLPGVVSGVPITYAAAGRQYVAVPVGSAAGSTAMFVFALPKAAATRSQ